MKVAVLTTSYPRAPDDVAGAFVRDAVVNLRACGIEVRVVSPASFRHFGIAYGHGIPGNLRRRPWRVLLLPLFLASFARAARRDARDVDLVHAHWLPSALAALTTRKPFVVQLWGTDVELAGRARRPARWLLRRARVVLCPSEALAASARALGARDVRVVPPGVALPDEVGRPEEPPHVLFVGRLSEEKGVVELLEATEGLPRVVVGDGPLRQRVHDAVGFVPPGDLGPYYERAAVVVCPSRREGYGVVAREAMAYGRPVVASAVGGLLDAVEDGVTGLLVPPRDPVALRTAIERLLLDPALRERLGGAARSRARERFSSEVATRETIAAFRAACADGAAAEPPRGLVEDLRGQERAWMERPLLRSLYEDWFDAIAARLSTAPGGSVELGSGIGRFHERYPGVAATDVEPTPWVDDVADAECLPYADGELSNLVLIDVFHHISRISRFFDEAVRTLSPGGRVIVLDPYCSTLSAPLYRRFHHERTDLDADPFADDPLVETSSLSSNQARATLVFFRARAQFEARWPELRIVERRLLAMVAYPLSGGFTGRPLAPSWAGRMLQKLEPALSWAAPALAFRCLVVVERSSASGAPPAERLHAELPERERDHP